MSKKFKLYARAILLSVAVHAAILLLLKQPPPPPHAPIRISLYHEPTKRIPAAPVSKEVPAARTEPLKGPRTERPKSSGRAQTAEPSPPRYADLLPGAGWQPVDRGNAINEVRGSPAAKKIAFSLQGHFYVPLSIRKVSSEGHAFGRLTRHSDAKILIDFIDGDPLCRAVLFEGLRDPAVFPQLMDLFAALSTPELQISLTFTKSTDDFRNSGHDFSVQVSGIKISVLHVFREVADVHAPSGGVGLILPDALAAKSMRHDMADADHLRASLAYGGPIRDYALNMP